MRPEMIELRREPLEPARLLDAVRAPGCGAEVLFLGTVRDHSTAGDARLRTLFLEYEAYEPMARRELEAIAAAVRERFGADVRVAMAHRLGRLDIGEASVAIAVAAPHRDEAYRASRYAIERLKHEVPIWKKEHFEGGEVWVEGPGRCGHGAADHDDEGGFSR